MTQITIHDGKPAISVKVHGYLHVDATDEARERAWNIVVEEFWRDATDLAHKRGYSGVFAEGRSNGWLVPYLQRTADGKNKFDRWPGQGPQHGYPEFPDVEHNGGAREKFKAFQRDIARLMEEAKENYKAIAVELTAV